MRIWDADYLNPEDEALQALFMCLNPWSQCLPVQLDGTLG